MQFGFFAYECRFHYSLSGIEHCGREIACWQAEPTRYREVVLTSCHCDER